MDKDYRRLMDLLPPDVEIVESMSGTYRFRADSLVRWLVDSKRIDLNQMCIDFQRGRFTLDDYMRFYRGLGYSLCGFIEIFGEYLWPEPVESR